MYIILYTVDINHVGIYLILILNIHTNNLNYQDII